jgi:hypothetical protein
MSDLRDFQKGYARPRSEVADWGADGTIGLLEVVEKVHPTIIVGTSTVGGAFTEQVVREMAKHANRPLIFPLSNPTERIEARPADAIHWTDGRALVGTGTPWAPVPYKGIDYRIGQANNALVCSPPPRPLQAWSIPTSRAPGFCPTSRTSAPLRRLSPWPSPGKRSRTASRVLSMIRFRRCRTPCGGPPTALWR